MLKAELKKPVALVLFGSPGSGKGTQSKYVVEWLGIPQISTGDILREHIRKGDAIGVAIAELLRAGSLVSDELANQLVRERISQEDCRRGFILDGYPRTTAQAEDSLAVARDNELWAGQQLVAQRSLAIELETNARLAQVETERRLSQVTLVQPIDPPVDIERDDRPNPKTSRGG